ncbi:MAG TPA: hypothetical protein VGK67_35155 [Myxococcales bacterium]|jgi:hypothetical protein
MRWLGDPPCTLMESVGEDLYQGRLELKGPALGTRFQGGINLLGSGMIARFALPLFRLPGPAKVLSLGILGAGAALGALGGAKLFARTTIVAERGKGITCWWKVPPRKARQRLFKARDIAKLEVRREQFAIGQVRTGSDVGHRSLFDEDRVQLGWELFVVHRKGPSVAIEFFNRQEDAEDRRRSLARVLRLPEEARSA